MEQEYQATTVEMDDASFDDLKDQLLDGKSAKAAIKDDDIRDRSEPSQQKQKVPTSKKYAFRKGDQTVELDDDYEFEMIADKKNVRMTLKELKDRAAGDIAVKNRMHSLAEEKKRVQSTFSQFAKLAKTDPIGALEFISGKATEADSEFEYNSYLEKLADQAERLGKMDDKDRKAWELEKKLTKAEQDLSHKERTEAVVLRKQEMLADYPEIGDSEFGQMVDAVLGNEELLEGLSDENDVMNKVEELIQETLTQRDIITVISEINPDYMRDDNLVFSLSDQLRQNPDLDENDIRDIISELVPPIRKARQTSSNERDRDIRTLSSKQRQAMGSGYRDKEMSTYDHLKQQLLENKENFKRTPIQLR